MPSLTTPRRCKNRRVSLGEGHAGCTVRAWRRQWDNIWIAMISPQMPTVGAGSSRFSRRFPRPLPINGWRGCVCSDVARRVATSFEERENRIEIAVFQKGRVSNGWLGIDTRTVGGREARGLCSDVARRVATKTSRCRHRSAYARKAKTVLCRPIKMARRSRGHRAAGYSHPGGIRRATFAT